MSDFSLLIRGAVHDEHQRDVYIYATLFFASGPGSVEDAWRWAESATSDMHHAPLTRLCPIDDLYPEARSAEW